MNLTTPAVEVANAFANLQSHIREELQSRETEAEFSCQKIESTNGNSRPCVLQGGSCIEKAAVLLTRSSGESLPPAATDRNPHLAGERFTAVSISVIVHPRNPHAPTAHMNLRFFAVSCNPEHWHFGGGFDLTPHLPYLEDAVHWHEHARRACGSDERYLELKRDCDRYFHLGHRGESRGIGGIFFDDLAEEPFRESFQFTLGVGEMFLNAYLTILDRRIDTPWTPEEEEWMLVRRGRYAEFNLAVDRGTRYGLQSGRSVEQVLASMPPRAIWKFRHEPSPNAPQQQLLQKFLLPRDWLGLEAERAHSEPSAGQ